MFDNVPEGLTDYLRDAAADFDRESFYYFAAAYVSLFYLKKNFTDERTSDFLRVCPGSCCFLTELSEHEAD